MSFLSTVLYFVITLGILVLIHELGHFLAAKMFRMRVDRFSIGFPPRAFGKKIGETDYCVSWLPLGGYVKIAGMIDESFDTEFLEAEPQPWEFRAKPIWQRMVVICAGVIMNILLAIAIFTGITYHQGSVLRETTTVGSVVDSSAAARAGLLAGDRIIAVNGTAVDHWDAIFNTIYLETLGNDLVFTVARGTQELQLTLPRAFLPEPDQASFGIIPTNTEIVVGVVDPGKPADQAGLKPNDVLVAMNGVPLQYDQRVREIVRSNAGKPLLLEWTREGQRMQGTAIPTADGRIGISYGARYNGPMKHIQYSLLESIPRGARETANVAVLFVQQIWQIVIGKTAFSQSVGGPIRIAQMATQTAEMGLLTYLGFLSLLSVSLAVLNILPFPALDGGHLFFLVYEAIFRREIPVKIKMGIQRAGVVLLLTFMAFVLYNDIVHF